MATKKHGIELLQGVGMFSTLSQRDLGKLWDQVRLVEHPPGDVIVKEGRGGQGFHVIVSGGAEVARKGNRVTLGPGDFFGEMSVIDEGPRTATVTTTAPTVVASLSAWDFKSTVKKQPELLWKLLVHTVGRLREEQSATDNLTA